MKERRALQLAFSSHGLHVTIAALPHTVVTLPPPSFPRISLTCYRVCDTELVEPKAPGAKSNTACLLCSPVPRMRKE